jgi:hypothetical protein
LDPRRFDLLDDLFAARALTLDVVGVCGRLELGVEAWSGEAGLDGSMAAGGGSCAKEPAVTPGLGQRKILTKNRQILKILNAYLNDVFVYKYAIFPLSTYWLSKFVK